MRTLLLNLHATRLPSYEDGFAYFGFTLCPTLRWEDPGDAPAADSLPLVQPWSWAELGPWSIAVPDQAGGFTIVSQATAVETGFPSNANAIRTALGPLAAKLTTRNGGSFDPAPLRDDAPSIDAAGWPTWRAWMSELSTRPAPLPQILRIAGFARLAEDEVHGPVRLLPRVVFADGTIATPQRSAPARWLGVYEWPYDVTPAATFAVVCKQPEIRGDERLSLELDLHDVESQRLPDPLPTITRDVTRDLESSLGELFDFSLHLVEALERIPDSLTPNTWHDYLKSARDVFLVCLRDRANDGDVEGPSGLSLAEMILARLHGDARTDLEALWKTSESSDPLLEWVLQRLRDRQRYLGQTDGDAYWGLRFWLRDFLGLGEGDEIPIPVIPAYHDAPEERRSRARAFAAELRSFRAPFRQESMLRDNVVRGWSLTFRTDTSALASGVRDALDGLSLVDVMAHGHLGPVWTVLGSGNVIELFDPWTLRWGGDSCHDDRFLASVDGLLQGAFASYVVLRDAIPAELMDVLREQRLLRTDSFLTKLLAERDGPTKTSEGLVLELQAPAFYTARHLESAIGQLAGYGLMLRRESQPPGEWLVPNLVDLDVVSTVGTVEVARSAVAPLKLGFRSRLRQGLVAYDGVPMAAPAPRLFDRHEARAEDPEGPALPIQTRSPFGFTEKLPPLVHGRTYEAAAYRIALSGAIDPDLAASDGAGQRIPWKLDRSRTPASTATVTYWRTVQVGAVTLAGGPRMARDGSAPPLDLPMPRGVVPLTPSLLSAAGDGAPPRALALLVPEDELSGGTPLWRGGARSRASFVILPPRVDVVTWERFARGTLATRDEIVAVRAEIFERADRAPHGDALGSGGGPDLMPDDPAVTAVAVVVRDARAGRELARLEVPLPATIPAREGLARFQRDPIPMIIHASVAGTAPAASAAAHDGRVSIELTVPPAWATSGARDPRPISSIEVLISPVVSAADTDRFLPEMRAQLETPVSVSVEIPAPLPLRPDELHAALDAAFSDERVTFSLRPEVLSKGLREGTRRLELALQSWRWDGRPVEHRDAGGWHPGFRFPPDPDGSAELAEDDVLLFGDRSASDHLTVATTPDLLTAAAGSPLTLHAVDLSTRPGAAYLRSSVKAISRYEEILDPGAGEVDSRRSLATGEAWRRHVVPCRHQGEVPAPAVRLIVPLTRAVSGAGLLVVLDESAHGPFLGGLAERLEAEIVSVRPPEDPKDPPPDPVRELGPDPLLDLDTTPFGAACELRVHGPVGYTFDTDTLAPLFRRAAIVLEPVPPLPAFSFVKVSLRRRLEPMLDGGTRESVATSPVWAQLLPPSDLWDVSVDGVAQNAVAIEHLAFSPSRGLTLGGRSAEPAPSRPGAAGRLSLWILVTRPVVDILDSTAGAEAYVDFVPHPITLPATIGCRVRLVEIQTRPGFPLERNPRDVFEALFPDQRASAVGSGREAAARIVRVSLPIEVREP